MVLGEIVSKISKSSSSEAFWNELKSLILDKINRGRRGDEHEKQGPKPFGEREMEEKLSREKIINTYGKVTMKRKRAFKY